MTAVSSLRHSLRRLLGTRYARHAVAAGVAVALVATLVAVNPGPRKVGTTAGSADDASGLGSSGSDGPTDVAAVDGPPDTTAGVPGAPGSSVGAGPGATRKGGKASPTKRSGDRTAASSGSPSAGGSSTGGSDAGGGSTGASDGGSGSAGASDGGSGGGSAGGSSGGGSGPPVPCGFKGCEQARGVSDREILLGVRWDPDNKAEYDSGRFPIHFGDVKSMARAMELDINRRNPDGIHGRRVKVVLYPNPDNPQEGPAGETTEQAETRYCVKFAEDLKVFALVTHWVGRVGAQCYADRRTLVFRTGAPGTVGDDARLKQLHPWVWTSPEKSNNRLWATLIPSLKEQGYFNLRTGAPHNENNIKVGIVLQDSPVYTNVRDLIRQKLEEAGFSEVEEFRYGSTGDFDFAALQAHGAAAANQFRARGVNRVLFVPGFLIFNFFMSQAEFGPNPYRPRYAVDSTMVLNGPVEKGVPNFPTDPAQLDGAMGIGWKKLSDVSGQGAGDYSAREQQCVAAMIRGGYPASHIENRTKPVLLQQHCETFWAFEEAAKRAGRGLNAGSLVAGVQGLGSSWESLVSYNVDFAKAAARGSGDASFGHRFVRYNLGKKIFEYDGGARPDR